MFSSLKLEINISAVRKRLIVCADAADDEIVIEKTWHSFVISECEPEIRTVPAAEFTEALERLHIEKWNEEYYKPALDGKGFILEYVTDDGKRRRITGSNAYPKNFGGLLSLLYCNDFFTTEDYP